MPWGGRPLHSILYHCVVGAKGGAGSQREGLVGRVDHAGDAAAVLIGPYPGGDGRNKAFFLPIILMGVFES